MKEDKIPTNIEFVSYRPNGRKDTILVPKLPLQSAEQEIKKGEITDTVKKDDIVYKKIIEFYQAKRNELDSYFGDVYTERVFDQDEHQD